MTIYPSLDLGSKIAVVIGGTSGIGLALAKGLAHAGADVIPTGRRTDLVRSAADEIRRLGRKTLALTSDVTDRDSLEALQQRVEGEVGAVAVWRLYDKGLIAGVCLSVSLLYMPSIRN